MIRDCSPVYANAITTVCPDAIQVADRWHLLKIIPAAESAGTFSQITLPTQAQASAAGIETEYPSGTRIC